MAVIKQILPLVSWGFRIRFSCTPKLNVILPARTRPMERRERGSSQTNDVLKILQGCSLETVVPWVFIRANALRERHNHKGNCKPRTLKVGDFVIVRGNENNRIKWPLGVIVDLFEDHYGVVHATKLRAGKSFLETPVQHLHPLELSCDNPRRTQETSNL